MSVAREHADTAACSPHQPIMLSEVLQHLRPAPGEVAVDCTLGAGSHGLAILERLQPGGRLIGLDVDPIELPLAEARLRSVFPDAAFTLHRRNFADLVAVLVEEKVAGADVILADLGVSAMQHDTPVRGFSYKMPGPLDMRMDPSRGQPASDLIARLDEAALAGLLADNADEPHAARIAHVLKQKPIVTTHGLERAIRTTLNQAFPALAKGSVKMSVRRTFQALRIAVNDEFAALERLLAALPAALASGGRVVVLTFHSGEDRRVKKAFQQGRRSGVYSAIAAHVVRSTKAETFSNRRAAAAKLRWAVRASG